ncbi:Coiled-coil domain-containing protein 190 [Lemmus lemmus]
MKNMDRNMARGALYTQFDLERKSARQAEARLSLNLQRLEVICLYHVKSLAREQRQLQKELQRLQQADIIKKRFSSYVENGIQKRLRDSVTFSPQTGRRHVATQPKISRVLAANMTQEAKTKIQRPSLHDTALKAVLRSQEHLQSQRENTSCYKEEYSGAQDGESVKPLKGTDSNRDVSDPCHDQEVSINNTEDCSPDGATGKAPIDETRSKNADLKPHGDAEDQNAPCSAECAGSFKGKCTKLTFLELFAKAKEAHYLRHRVPPESERLLSIGEIFGHGDVSLPRVGKKL